MIVGTIAAGVGTATTINLTYLPQYLYWNNATTIQSLQVSIQTDGVLANIDTNGLNAFSALRLPGRVTNGFYFPLTNGYIANKNVELAFVNNVAAAIPIYGFSLQKGNQYVQTLRSAALANSGITLNKFAALGLPSFVAADLLNVEYKDGWIQQLTPAELQAELAFYQNDVNGAANLSVDNFQQNIKSVRFTPAAAQTVYIMRFISPGALNPNVSMG